MEKKRTMSKRILIVEDDLFMRMLLEYNLKKAGYQISAANNGHKGLKIAKKEKPDLVISDVNMSKLNGFELCQKLKGDIETKRIPIILLTSNSQIQDKLRGFKSGADDYITKPFHLEEFLARVHSLLERRDSPAQETDID